MELSADPTKLNAAITAAHQNVQKLQQFSNVARADLQRLFAAQHLQAAAGSLANARFMGEAGASLNTPAGKMAMHARAREDMARETVQWQEKIAYARQYQRVLNSPEGRRFLEEQARAHREIGQFRADEKWRRLVIEQGRVGATISSLEEKFSSFGQTAARISAVGGASIAGMVRAASPAHWATFLGSIELLAARVGGDLTPRVEQASEAIQDLSGQWRELSPTTRSWAVDIGLATVALAGLHTMTRTLVLPVMRDLWAIMRGTSAVGANVAGRAGQAMGRPGPGGMGRLGVLGALGAGGLQLGSDLVDRSRGQGRPWWDTALALLLGGRISRPQPQAAERPPAFARDTAPGRAEMLARQGGQAARAPRGRPARSGLLTDMGPFEPERGGFEDQWWRIQMAASRISPLRGAIMQEQHRNRLRLLGQNPDAPGGGGGGGGGDDPVAILRDIRDAVQAEARRPGGLA